MYGLYSCISGSLPYVLFGSCAQLIVGPTAVLSLLVRSAIPGVTASGKLVEEASAEWVGFALIMSFMVGLFQILFSISGLAVCVQLVSEPIMQGFVTASALLMMASQVATMLGVPRCNPSDLLGPGHDHEECYIQEYIVSLWKRRSDIHTTTALLSLGSILALASLSRAPRRYSGLSKAGPVLLSTTALCFFYWLAKDYGTTKDEQGQVHDARWNVRLVGPIPAGLPHPMLPWEHVSGIRNVMKVFTPSLVIALLGFMESMAIATTVSRQTKSGNLVPSRELIGIGSANLFGSFFQAYPVTGSFSRTAVNLGSGAQSKASGFIASLMIGVVLLLLSDMIQYMPNFALAAIVLIAALNLLKPFEAIVLYRTNRLDFSSFLLVLIVTLFSGFERGLACGVLISWVGTMLDRSPPMVWLLKKTDSGFKDVPSSSMLMCDVVILQVESALLFSNVLAVENAMMSACEMFKPACVILDLEQVGMVDASGIRMLQMATEYARESLPVPMVIVSGLHGAARRTIERAKEANTDLHWNLAPLVSGLGDSSLPHLVSFRNTHSALEFVSNRFSASLYRTGNFTFGEEVLTHLNTVRLQAWRQGESVQQVLPSWRTPKFLRQVPFRVAVATGFE